MVEDFDQVILSYVDEALGLLGKDGKSVVYWLWESKSGLGRERIPSHIDQFLKILKGLFGTGGAIMESYIVTKISHSFEFQDEPANLIDAIRMAKERFSSDEIA
ncbi:MAG: hypothetical protein JRN15_09940 [Nitrososphaerota archaeon]|nr:hypothetical protein [Nitrososphaerota archaeon]